jgi:hypothetical protein
MSGAQQREWRDIPDIWRATHADLRHSPDLML